MSDHGSTSPRKTRWQAVLVYLSLLVAAVAIFGRTTGFDFVYYDDPDYVTRNAVVRDGLSARGLLWALTATEASNWHPLTWVSHMLDVELFGLDAGAHHGTSVALHVINAWLLFALLRRTTGALWPSAAVAALFAVHPAHVESVAWVAERKDVLSTLFFLAALLAYAAWARQRGWGRYLLVTALFALGLLAKPMVVTLPAVMLLFDYWPLGRAVATPAGRELRRLLVEKLPWFAMAGAASAMTLAAQHAGGSLAATDLVPLAHRLANAVVSYVRYLGMLFWPTSLSVLYPHPNLAGGTPWTPWQVGLAGGALAVLTALAFHAGTPRRFVPFGWLWYLITLGPVIGVVQVGQQALADRYTYVPFIGPFVVIAWGAAEVFSRGRWRSRGVRTAVAAAALSGLVVLSVVSWRQVGRWRDTIALFEHALAVSAPAPVALTNLGAALAEQGRLDEAIARHRQALEIDPDDLRALNNLGLALQLAGRLEEAIASYRRALALAPDRVTARHNLATALRDAGFVDEAIVQYRQVLLLEPDAIGTHRALAEALRRAGRHEEAADHEARGR